MATGDEAPKAGGERQVNPDLHDTPLKKLSGIFKNLFVGGPEADAKDAVAPPPSAPPAPVPPERPGGSTPLGRGSGPLPPSPPQAPRSPAGQLPPLPGHVPFTPRQRAGTDTLSLGTGRLPPQQPVETKPEATPAIPEATLAAESERSDKRMAFIVAYMRDPTSRPEFQDRPFVFRVVSEERSYQQTRIIRARQALETLAPEAGEARAALQMQLDEALARQAKLFTLLKTLTGRLGKTGGTGFLGGAPAAKPTPPNSGGEAPEGA